MILQQLFLIFNLFLLAYSDYSTFGSTVRRKQFTLFPFLQLSNSSFNTSSPQQLFIRIFTPFLVLVILEREAEKVFNLTDFFLSFLLMFHAYMTAPPSPSVAKKITVFSCADHKVSNWETVSSFLTSIESLNDLQ